MSSPSSKNNSVYQKQKSGYMFRHPVPLRGALRNVPARGGEAVDGDGVLTRAPEADGEIVWFRHPQAGVKFAA